MVMFTQRMYQGLVYKIGNISTTQVTQSKGDGGESRVCPQTFRSRWTTLFWWRKATPSRICLMSLFTSSSLKASSSWSDTHWLKISPPAALQQKTHDVGQISCKSVDWPSVMCQCQSILHHSGLQTLREKQTCVILGLAVGGNCSNPNYRLYPCFIHNLTEMNMKLVLRDYFVWWIPQDTAEITPSLTCLCSNLLEVEAEIAHQIQI